jgi:signal transduction histidine kinase
MNLLVSGAVLLIAAVAFFSYNLISFRNDLIVNLQAEAQIVGENSISALTFDDRQSAAATLKTLENSPDVKGAVLVDRRGDTFARYGRPGDDGQLTHVLPAASSNSVWFSGMHVLVAHRIRFEREDLGTVYISATLREVGHRAWQYFLIACIIFLFCMGAALVISSLARRLVVKPITELADTALLVSRDRDYSIRANIEAHSQEVGVLISAFNTMLEQIEQRDAALEEARNGLEARVEERTADLRAANRELEAFSYTVAHDLRGPLDAIGGIGFLLTGSYGDISDPSIQTMLAQLTTSTTNMGLLIDDLLNFARASTKPAQSAPVSLTAIVREIATELSASNPERQVEFVIAETPEVIADAGLMRVALDNLLRNAWKYTSRHATARIEFGMMEAAGDKHVSGKTVYFVRDDGSGFDPTRMARLFQPFERLHSKGEFPGTGIGLATVHRILSRMGGEIWAEGAVEKGATFFFRLD